MHVWLWLWHHVVVYLIWCVVGFAGLYAIGRGLADGERRDKRRAAERRRNDQP